MALDATETRNPPTPGLPARYSLVCLRSGDPKYRLFYGDTQIYSASDPGHVMGHLFCHINAEAIHQTGSFVLVHAGAVVTPRGQAVLMPATSGSGKTTLTAALIQAGFGYLTDEAAAIDPVSRNVHSYAKALTMKDALVLDALGCVETEPAWRALMSEGRHVHPHELRADSTAAPAPVGYVIAPRYEAGAATSLEPMAPAQTAAEVMRHTMNSRRYGRRSLAVISEIARHAHGFRLVSGDLDDAVATVMRITR